MSHYNEQREREIHKLEGFEVRKKKLHRCPPTKDLATVKERMERAELKAIKARVAYYKVLWGVQ